MTFEQLGRILIKRWVLVVTCFLLVGLGAFIGTSKLIKPLYQSSVLIEVIVRTGGNPLTNDNILASQQLAATEANLATTGQILGEVASHYPGLSVDDLTKEVIAAPKDSTQLFEIDVLDPNPTRAANLANDIAATLINQQLQVTQYPVAQGNFLVITQSAQPASSPARPNKLIYSGAGLLIGLLLGILLAVILELLDTRIRTKEVLAQVVDWPVLGTIWRTPREEAVINSKGYNSNAESYGTLHMNIGFVTVDKPLHTLVVTSAMPRDGKSVVAANLAICMAKTGKKTLLIDANLRQPILHEEFNIPARAMGFSNAILAFKALRNTNTSAYRQDLAPTTYTESSSASIVTDEPSLDSFARVVDIPNLYVMPSGPLPPNPPELLDSKAMQRFFAALSRCGAEVVIFDTPSLLGLPDACILASKADATLVVVDTTRTSKSDLKQVKVLLEQAGANVIGCVVNKQRRSHKNTPYLFYYRVRKQSTTDKDKPEKKGTSSSTISSVIPETPPPVASVTSKQRKTLSQPEKKKQLDGGKRKRSTNGIASSTPTEDVFDESDETVTLPVAKIRGAGD